MSEKSDDAGQIFSQGFNCAQSVLCAFAKDGGLRRDDALRVAGAFGAGMGRMGEVCGAVTGAFMAIGLRYAKTTADEDAQKAVGYELVNRFTRRFCEMHGTIHCRKLLGVDLSTAEGMEKAVAKRLFQTQCAMYVTDAVKLLEALLTEAEDERQRRPS